MMIPLTPRDAPTTNGSDVPPFLGSRLPLSLIHPIAAALLGSYAFTWGFTALGVAVLVVLGVDFHQAETTLMLLAFLVFLPLFLWSFASPRQGRVMALLFGGAALMTAAAWAIQSVALA